MCLTPERPTKIYINENDVSSLFFESLMDNMMNVSSDQLPGVEGYHVHIG